MDWTNRVVLITGGSSGIGQALAELLSKRGARLHITGRNETRLNQVVRDIRDTYPGATITGHLLDLSALTNVEKFCQTFLQTENRLDILVNNAGQLGPQTFTDDGLESTFAVNHLSHVLLTDRLFTLLHRHSRLVVVTSDQHRRVTSDVFADDDVTWLTTYAADYDVMKAYGRSKMAGIMFAKEFAKRYATTGIDVCSVHPGIVHTNILRHWPGWYGWLLRQISSYFFMSAEKSASLVLPLLTDNRPLSGQYYEQGVPVQLDENVTVNASQLWQLSVKTLEERGFRCSNFTA